MIKRMGKFDWCAVIEKQWCNLWKRQNVLSLQCSTLGVKSFKTSRLTIQAYSHKVNISFAAFAFLTNILNF